MPQVIKAEEHRSHDPLVHHWLSTMGFKALLTDMSGPVPGTNMEIATRTTLPSPERQGYRETKLAWESYFRGEQTLKELMQQFGNSIVLVAPDRMEAMPRLVSKVQRDLLELHMGEDKVGCQHWLVYASPHSWP